SEGSERPRPRGQREAAQKNGVQLVVLPGDDKPDPGLARFLTVDPGFADACWEYFREGGQENMENLLRLVDSHLNNCPEPPAAVPLMKAGVWSPNHGICNLDTLKKDWIAEAPVVAVCFYRALVQSGGLSPIEAMVDALSARGINALPIFVSSLKDPLSVEIVRSVLSEAGITLAINATGFAVSPPTGQHKPSVLDEGGIAVLQVVLAGGSKESWHESSVGLSSRDLAMNVALPEVDGRVFTRAIAFKNAARFDEDVQANIVVHEPEPGRIAFVADLAENWIRLRLAKPQDKKVAVVLANYPNRDGRLGNGVGLDTPAGTINVLRALEESGYQVGTLPDDGDSLIAFLQQGPTNATVAGREVREVISIHDYNAFFETLPNQIQAGLLEKWGKAEADPYFVADINAFALPLGKFGNVVVGIQPARGYHIDPTETYHSPDLVPPHGYVAFYAWLRKQFSAHAVVHMGKHGNLEWLPGKALSLSEACYPEAVIGPVPNFYPFIVNDPGEGTQAKRRISSVIIDHLTPPLTRAESYGPLRDLEALVDEYYEASGNDPRRLRLLRRQILELIEDIGLDEDAGISADDRDDDKLEKLDGYLCELKELQIRDGLHVFGASPQGNLKRDLLASLVRVPRASGQDEDQSLQRAIALDLGLEFDPLDCDMAAPWVKDMPQLLKDVSQDPWRTHGDTVERIELLAQALVSAVRDCPKEWENSLAVLSFVKTNVQPAVEACGAGEIAGLISGLDGDFTLPGPSGAPTRGRLDVLPTGRNFYSVDCRSVPTPAAWELGKKSAELLIKRYRQDHGAWPTSFGLSVWGTSNMRTGGDDIAQALALIGVKPVWDHGSRRVTGYEIIPLAELGRPRVDVMLRISGFFRDAFPAQIELYDKAIRAVGALQEEPDENPVAKRMGDEQTKLLNAGVSFEDATRRAGFRIFGSKPGAYGAGLQALIDEKGWQDRGDLAEAYLSWGSYAYGQKEEGQADRPSFASRLSDLEAVIHNQDNREHDLLDSDDYYQFEGGMTAAVEHVSGKRPS
ncbi:MAG: cobaltochelatase subunit CobN, partial [Pseudomonadota bacterium]